MCDVATWGSFTEVGCPGSVGNAIAAAFETQGYYVQADIIWQLASTNFGLWAPALYIMSAISGLFMMAMGQPPKTYLWFFMGPAFFKWTLFTTYPVKGAAWRVAGVQQNQVEVWKLAEIGLINTSIAIESANRVGGDRLGNWGTTGKIDIDAYRGPMNNYPFVSKLFLEYNAVISSTVQAMSAWTGVYSLRKNTRPSGSTQQEPTSITGTAATADDKAWHILTNSKWPMLENVTGSYLQNVDVRDSLQTLMASECGDLFAKYIDRQAFIAAAHSKGRYLPRSIFDRSLEEELNLEAMKVALPMPIAVQELVSQRATANVPGSAFRDFVSKMIALPAEGMFPRSIDCASLLHLVVQGFRWESGHIYNQLIREMSGAGLTEDAVVYNFLYGWRIKRTPSTFDASGLPQEGTPPVPLTIEEQKNFVKDLILLHLFRNELAFVANPVAVRWSPAEKARDYAQASQRSISSKNKYGELYTWAKMMPYLQGLLLYVLAIAYPFVCIVMVIPGWWKTLFTWMAFWAWAKSWDVGFAIVQTLERSVWAMVGNSADAEIINSRIYGLQYSADNPGGLATVAVNCVETTNRALGCPIPVVTSVGGWDGQGFMGFPGALQLFDFALLMASNLDLDLSNSYYVYLMSAMYFAVPAVTGQVLLGAKAGATGMIQNMVGGVASEVGRMAGQGFTGEAATMNHHALNTTGQAAFAKALRSGQAGQMLNAQYDAANASQDQSLKGKFVDTNSSLIGQESSRIGAIAKGNDGRLGLMGAGYKTATGIVKAGAGSSGAGASADGDAQGGTGAAGGATAAGAGGGGGGAGTVSPFMKSFQNAMSGKKGLGAAAREALNSGPGFAVSAGQTRNNEEALMAQMEAMGQQAENAVESFGHSAASAGHGAMSQRYAGAAAQGAQEAQWRQMRNYAESIGGKAAAMGMLAGAFQAGPKPMSVDGMMGLGMLDAYSGGEKTQDRQGKWTYMDPVNGTYGQNVAAYKDGLNGQAKTISGPTRLMDSPAAANYAVEATGNYLGAVAGGEPAHTTSPDKNYKLSSNKPTTEKVANPRGM